MIALATETELAQRWGLNNNTLAKMRMARKAGADGPEAGPSFVKIGRNIRYRIDDIVLYEEENLN